MPIWNANDSVDFYYQGCFFVIKTANVENLRQNKNRFSLNVVQMLDFTSSANTVGAVKGLIHIRIVRFILSENFDQFWHTKGPKSAQQAKQGA